MEDFSGYLGTFRVLFEAALDGDVVSNPSPSPSPNQHSRSHPYTSLSPQPDEVYDALDLRGDGWDVTYGVTMIIIYR